MDEPVRCKCGKKMIYKGKLHEGCVDVWLCCECNHVVLNVLKEKLKEE